jgi:hypothetical protein
MVRRSKESRGRKADKGTFHWQLFPQNEIPEDHGRKLMPEKTKKYYLPPSTNYFHFSHASGITSTV